jgi:Tol biopolymer transport system component
VFCSDRSGSRQAWLLSVNGRKPRPLTGTKTWVGILTWSPSGDSILFRHGNDIAELKPDDPTIRLRTQGFHTTGAGWNRDGSIYFVSNRSQGYQVWLREPGRQDRQITRTANPIHYAWLDQEQGSVYFDFLHDTPSGIWSAPVSGGKERLVAPVGRLMSWRIRAGTAYYVKRDAPRSHLYA